MYLLAMAEDSPPLLLELHHSRRCRAPYYFYLLRQLLRRDAALVEEQLGNPTAADIGLSRSDAASGRGLRRRARGRTPNSLQLLRALPITVSAP